MNDFLPRFLCLFLLTAGFSHPALAGPDSPPSSFPADTPIDTRMDLGLFGLLGGGMVYTVKGKPISRYEDFKALIYTQRDTEASDMIREADEAHSAAWIFYIAGAATGVDVALAFKPVPLIGVDWFDRISTGIVATEVFWGLGALFDNNAEARKYNAIQRYNQLVEEEKKETFLDLKPQITLAQQGPGLGLSCAF